MNKFNRTNITIGLVQGFYWTASCVFVSFLVRLLRGCGYSDYECGVALSVSALSSLSVQPVIGRIADRMKRVSILIAVCFLFSSISSLLLIPFHENRILTFILIFIIFGAFRSLIYVIDLWSFSSGNGKSGFSYGFTRSFGALFYALSAPFFGWAIDESGIGIIIPSFIIFSLLAFFMVLIAPKGRCEEKNDDRTGVAALSSKLFRNRYYCVLLISYMLIEMTSIPGQNYLTRKFELLSGGEVYTGTALLVMGLLQLPSLNTIERLNRKMDPIYLIWISLFGLMLRGIILAISTTPITTVAAFLTEPFAFGLYIGAVILYMRKYLESDVIYSGMTLYSAITGGLGGIIGNYLGGLIAERRGVMEMFSIMSIPAVLGFLIFSLFVLGIHLRDKRIENKDCF